jgi:hypothetical protein
MRGMHGQHVYCGKDAWSEHTERGRNGARVDLRGGPRASKWLRVIGDQEGEPGDARGAAVRASHP